MIKNLPANAGDAGSVPGLEKSSVEENYNPIQYACLENLMNRRSWAGYSPWRYKRVRHNLATKQQKKM